jgi:hypothetical protein
MAQITIDFFELAFLAESCIPPRPIARSSFWHRLINEIHNQLSVNERERLFEIIVKNTFFDKENEECQWFYARFNPKNQFWVSCFHEGKASTIQCFRKDDSYWTSKTRFVNEQYIKSVEAIFEKS